MLLKLCEIIVEQVKTMSMNLRSYSELITLPTFIERFNYLQCKELIGYETFGHDRYLNQSLYRSSEWRRFRRDIIIRDNGCDLGCDGYELYSRIVIHHINPLTVEDILNRSSKVFDPENAICTCLNTHQAIHFGDETILNLGPIERKKNDTCPWRHD